VELNKKRDLFDLLGIKYLNRYIPQKAINQYACKSIAERLSALWELMHTYDKAREASYILDYI